MVGTEEAPLWKRESYRSSAASWKSSTRIEKERSYLRVGPFTIGSLTSSESGGITSSTGLGLGVRMGERVIWRSKLCLRFVSTLGVTAGDSDTSSDS